MKILLLLLFTLCCLAPAFPQRQLLLENSQTGKQRTIDLKDRIHIGFISRYEKAKVNRQGRVLSISDSTLSFNMKRRGDTVTVALAQITKIGKYRSGGTGLLAVAAGAAGGAAWAVLDGSRDRYISGALAFLGASLVYNGLEALVYPKRKVNRPGSAWRLKVSPQ